MVAIGSILILVGGGLVYISYSTIDEIESYNILGLPIDDFLEEFNPELRGQYILAHFVILFGSIVLITGGILLYMGILSIKPLKKTFQPKEHARLLSDGANLEEDPLKILQLRYAKGKISREEFMQMKKDIKGGK
jgi:uncharacterized membrane protein